MLFFSVTFRMKKLQRKWFMLFAIQTMHSPSNLSYEIQHRKALKFNQFTQTDLVVFNVKEHDFVRAKSLYNNNKTFLIQN